ncbi:TIGR01777 family oxidoreductase [Motiliproteus sediminis]|uniref:TIGR01777 family oxidoreductase n=1 Tax=Motiliproteus sediminis TaxID=1468178 RepID=UPI001AF0204D|nr:TIGR01777 family oxidoreductase [Motiliproteus sediminis]
MKSDSDTEVLITGASGFIGGALIDSLLADGIGVIGLSRRPEKLQRRFPGIRVVADLNEITADCTIDAVVNLAGEPILDARWSETRKRVLYDSRLDTTRQLVALIERLDTRPATLVSGSAIGFYGSHDSDRVLLEQDDGRACFAHELCRDWEAAAQQAEGLGLRVCLLRTGVVLGQGGALKRMLPPFRLGLGGPIGQGRQWMSWVHLEDMVALIRFLLDHQVLSGVFNATAPEPVTNKTFSQTLGAVLNRPAVLPVPPLMLKLILGEGATLLTEGQRVVPARLLEAGFEFRYPELKPALQSILT